MKQGKNADFEKILVVCYELHVQMLSVVTALYSIFILTASNIKVI